MDFRLFYFDVAKYSESSFSFLLKNASFMIALFEIKR